MKPIAWVLLLAAAPALAADLHVGNIAPGAGNVQIMIGADRAGPPLGYLGFATAQRDDGILEVSAIASGDRLLATATVRLQRDQRVRPLLLLTGDGNRQPYALRLLQDVGDDGSSNKALSDTSVGAHHFASYEGAEVRGNMEAVVACRGSSATGSVSSGLSIHEYGDSATVGFDSPHATNACTLKVAHPEFGSYDLASPLAQGTLRFLLVGDGLREPFRVAVLQNGTLLQTAGESAPAIGAVTRSDDFWYDLERPSQGVNLYEIPGADDVFGTWFTHGEDGKPIWYFFDGIATDLPGQRELVVYRPSRGNARSVMTAVGSARLFYLDCNQAELRILMGERDYFPLRIRRSREVASCDALE